MIPRKIQFFSTVSTWFHWSTSDKLVMIVNFSFSLFLPFVPSSHAFFDHVQQRGSNWIIDFKDLNIALSHVGSKSTSIGMQNLRSQLQRIHLNYYKAQVYKIFSLAQVHFLASKTENLGWGLSQEMCTHSRYYKLSFLMCPRPILQMGSLLPWLHGPCFYFSRDFSPPTRMRTCINRLIFGTWVNLLDTDEPNQNSTCLFMTEVQLRNLSLFFLFVSNFKSTTLHFFEPLLVNIAYIKKYKHHSEFRFQWEGKKTEK